MIKKILIGIGIFVILLVALGAWFFFYGTRQASPMDNISYQHQDTNLELSYCQPSVKGRLIFGTEEDGALQPYGKYWRLGANQATKLTINNPISINGSTLKAGSYSVYAIPGESEWKIGFNEDADRWGAMEPDYEKDVLNIQVPAERTEELQEMLKIQFEGSGNELEMVIRWENYRASIPIEISS